MKRITLIQLGIGTVGGAVVDQVLANQERWRERLGLDVVIGGIIGRSGALLDLAAGGLPPATLHRVVEGRRHGSGLGEVVDKEGRELIPAAEAIAEVTADRPLILLDAGAGAETAPLDVRALTSGAGVVLSNKAPLALPLSNPLAGALWNATEPGGHVRYEATCGAGLPVISTLRSLLDTGDKVLAIEGALSGTLGAIFTSIANGSTFSSAVRAAKEQGFTEPDPRDDLSGLDVARKALILARTIGRRVDLDEVEVESLVPSGLRDVDIDTFMERVSELDARIAADHEKATADSRALKYVANVRTDGSTAVGLQAIPTAGVLGALQGPENVVSIQTRRYDTYPVTIVGPGAGAAVTAAGMLADTLALATDMLGGPRTVRTS